MGRPANRDSSHSGLLDAELLTKQTDLGAQAVALRGEANASNAAVGAPTAYIGDTKVRESERLHEGRAYVRRPSVGNREVHGDKVRQGAKDRRPLRPLQYDYD